MFPGNLQARAALARALRKTAADRDKNNYSSTCLPRDTLSTRPTPFPYELLHFRSPARTIKPFTIKTRWLNVLTQAHVFHHAGWKQKYCTLKNSTLFWPCLYFINQCQGFINTLEVKVFVHLYLTYLYVWR